MGDKLGHGRCAAAIKSQTSVAYVVLLSQGMSKCGFFRVPGWAMVLGETEFGWGYYHSQLINSYKIVYTCIVQMKQELHTVTRVRTKGRL